MKLDAGHYAAEEKKYKLNFIISLKKSFKTIVRKIFEKSLDLISTETYNAFNAYKLSFPERKNKIIHIPNGIDFKFLKSLGVEHSQKTDKENLIITVARIGIKEKNNQMMLNALNGLEMKDWKFAFIGPIEHSFDSEIKAFYSQNPQLIEKVIFTGAISNRKELYSWYGKAKAFCLTSPSESFCIAMSDSLYFGCEIISTPVISFDDITNKNEFGYKIRDVDDLRDVLKRIIDGRIDICVNFEKIVAYSKRFDWTDICEKLDKRFGGRN
ncbi:MAG: glycosyltransferase family 4 protein [Chitinispirillales bacterium]|nr:glycosyltransferase family 4 protein [Chitinispirillales bacterium]